MVKKGSNVNKAVRRTRPGRRSRLQSPSYGPRFTEAERAYAQLLADPCNGPLVSGPFGDGSGGIVTRFEFDFIANAGASQTASALCFIPGEPKIFTSGTLLASNTPITWSELSGSTPGWTFLNTNCSQFRCLAACMQIYWPGSELNRQGIVSLGQFGGDVLFDGTMTPDEIRIASPYVERTPESMVEIKWRPNEYDTMWSEFNLEREGTASGTLMGKKSTLVGSGVGLPVDTGLRYRVVAVYEWKPKVAAGLGLVVSNGHGQVKTGSLSNVLRWLDSTGDWMYNGAHAIGRTASKLAAGVGSIASLTNGLGRLGRAIMAPV